MNVYDARAVCALKVTVLKRRKNIIRTAQCHTHKKTCVNVNGCHEAHEILGRKLDLLSLGYAYFKIIMLSQLFSCTAVELKLEP